MQWFLIFTSEDVKNVQIGLPALLHPTRHLPASEAVVSSLFVHFTVTGIARHSQSHSLSAQAHRHVAMHKHITILPAIIPYYPLHFNARAPPVII